MNKIIFLLLSAILIYSYRNNPSNKGNTDTANSNSLVNISSFQNGPTASFPFYITWEDLIQQKSFEINNKTLFEDISLSFKNKYLKINT